MDMKVRVKVDIITGFLGSGKTTFINLLLADASPATGPIVVIQNECGEVQVDSKLMEQKHIQLYLTGRTSPLDKACIMNVLDKHQPSRIIIEHNGMEQTEKLLQLFDDTQLYKKCIINKIYHLIDVTTYHVYMNNMGSLLSEQIAACDTILLSNGNDFPVNSVDIFEKSIKAINKKAEIMWFARAPGSIVFKDANAFEEASLDKKDTGDKVTKVLFKVFLALVLSYMLFSIIRSAIASGDLHLDLAWAQVLVTVFISILIQAFPFILVGVFVSSIIQVLVSNDVIARLFTKNAGISYLAAIFAGVLFPVCDCAIVPVAQRLIRKGVPVPVAITFMLSAPIVNPIVIASTLYAFPGQPYVALYRVLIGIVIALAVGLFISLVPSQTANILKNEATGSSCGCGFCGNAPSPKGFREKVEAIFKHAGTEFFTVGKFLIIGAFLSGVVQTFVPKDIFSGLGSGFMISLLIMMLSAFVLSVCSTSDAFIARTFVRQFALGPVMGFMVLGPMIDIKNVLMLTGNFKKSFVIKLVILIFAIAFVVLMMLALPLK
jgi:uncharacterized protein